MIQLDRIRDCVVRGDWTQADSIACKIAGQQLGLGQESLTDYLTCLQETLVLAKRARANAITALARVNAAAGFHNPDLSPQRHNSVVSAIS